MNKIKKLIINMTKLEYIWLDGYTNEDGTPDANLRSKTTVITKEFNGTLKECKQWSYDGSSTKQATGDNSDCILNPVYITPDYERTSEGHINAFLVMCEVLNPDGTPHESNHRRHIKENDEDYWFGFEQEYTIMEKNRTLGHPKDGFPRPQGPYYCAVGDDNVVGRNIVEEHLNVCLKSGLNITGINAEVMLGQWEYQLLGKGTQTAADQLWISRYLLHRITEKYGLKIEFHPKPIKGDWNGSGLHVNFSNEYLREEGGEEYVTAICEALRETHQEHIDVYGSSNRERLTGAHETQHIDEFSYGVSNRGASIRIPIGTKLDGWKGYLEDRRPASNADPYLIVNKITDSISDVQVLSEVES